MRGHCRVRSLCPRRKRGLEGLAPSSEPPSLSGEKSEVKPGGSTAQQVWLWDLLVQHKEMDTKMLERPTMTANKGANSLASNHSGRDRHVFFLSY